MVMEKVMENQEIVMGKSWNFFFQVCGKSDEWIVL